MGSAWCCGPAFKNDWIDETSVIALAEHGPDASTSVCLRGALLELIRVQVAELPICHYLAGSLWGLFTELQQVPTPRPVSVEDDLHRFDLAPRLA